MNESRIALKQFEKTDVEQLLAWNDGTSKEFLLQWAGPDYHYPLTGEQITKEMEAGSGDKPVHLFYKVVLKENNEVVGHCQLLKISYKNSNARIGRVLVGSPDCRGKGYGKELIRCLLDIAFKQLGLHRVDLGVFDYNHAAIKCYEDVGLKKEGLFRDISKLDDTYYSAYNMSILEHEYR